MVTELSATLVERIAGRRRRQHSAILFRRLVACNDTSARLAAARGRLAGHRGATDRRRRRNQHGRQAAGNDTLNAAATCSSSGAARCGVYSKASGYGGSAAQDFAAAEITRDGLRIESGGHTTRRVSRRVVAARAGLQSEVAFRVASWNSSAPRRRCVPDAGRTAAAGKDASVKAQARFGAGHLFKTHLLADRARAARRARRHESRRQTRGQAARQTPARPSHRDRAAPEERARSFPHPRRFVTRVLCQRRCAAMPDSSASMGAVSPSGVTNVRARGALQTLPPNASCRTPARAVVIAGSRPATIYMQPHQREAMPEDTGTRPSVVNLHSTPYRRFRSPVRKTCTTLLPAHRWWLYSPKSG